MHFKEVGVKEVEVKEVAVKDVDEVKDVKWNAVE